jgi:dihydroorotate dehydrogenase electron transfer subunit
LSGWRGRPETMRATRLVEVREEAADMRTLYFHDELCSGASPGQYVMLWIPGVDEIPMSISTIGRGGPSSVTVQPVGEATKALCGMGEGDKIGLRGPFGRRYKIKGRRPLIVAGGTGVASVTPLAELMVENGLQPTLVLGARSEGLMVFRERLEGLLGEGLVLSTDDGSCGYHGFASDCAGLLLDEGGFDSVYTCGPELMMAAVFRKADGRGLPVQASLERYIKCAVGLCASCAIGPYRVCKDGPVFDSDMLREVVEEFGRRRMDPSGRAVPVDH